MAPSESSIEALSHNFWYNGAAGAVKEPSSLNIGQVEVVDAMVWGINVSSLDYLLSDGIGLPQRQVLDPLKVRHVYEPSTIAHRCHEKCDHFIVFCAIGINAHPPFVIGRTVGDGNPGIGRCQDVCTFSSKFLQ
jgi:hypothetical protein